LASDRVHAIEQQLGDDLADLRGLTEVISANGSRLGTEQLQLEMRQAEAERERLAQELAQLEQASADPERFLTAPGGLLNNHPGLRKLREGLVEAQLEAVRLQGRYTDQHPKLRAAKVAVELIVSQLNSELQAVVGAARQAMLASEHSQLTGVATPWLLGNIEWTDALIKRAMLWLVQRTGKALLKVDDDDFRAHDLHQLLRHHGPAQRLAHRVFRWMMDTINYHPAGREAQTVLCFSPHPDDDVISMGGTLIRLVEDGHRVHVAYMTSGNIAVFDHDARRVADLVTEYNRIFDIDTERSAAISERVEQALKNKQPGQSDDDTVLKIKGLIRWGEARAGAIKVGCREEDLHFLDLPFYRTGTIAKKPVGEEDVAIIRELLRRVGPQQVYVAGDLADPHGTHRVCAEAIFMALRQMQQQGESIPEVLLYRGAWQEYPLHEIEIAVPLSPSDIELKRQAIFMHESQKDEALFPGSDPREFWERAEDRNRGTAEGYNQIGLPEFFALEAFTRWKGNPI
jgi:glucosamine-6-phosphate deaminase